MKKLNKGFTLIELVSVSAIATVLGGVSFFYLREARVKQFRKEAMIELGLLYRGQTTYRLKHGYFSDGIQDIMFPSGAKRYNVGHNEIHSGLAHNFKQLCSSVRKNCSMIPTTIPSLPDDAKCTQDNPKNFKAYAIGDIYDNAGNSDAEKLDKWTVDQSGVFDNCQDPTDKNEGDTC